MMLQPIIDQLKEECTPCVGTSSYGLFDDEGVSHWTSGAICAAGVKYIDSKKKKAARGIIIGVCYLSEILDNENTLPYYKWLLEESFLSEFFIKDRPTEDLVKTGYLFFSPKANMSFVVAATMLVRYPWENEKILNNWGELVEEGLSNDAAFFFAHCHERYNPSLCPTNNTNHTMFNKTNMSREAYINFLSHKDVVKYKEPYDSARNTHNFTVSGMWREAPDRSDSLVKEISRRCVPWREVEETEFGEEIERFYVSKEEFYKIIKEVACLYS